MRQQVGIAFGSTRLALILLGYVVLTAFPTSPLAWQGSVFPDSSLIDGWVRWDSMWYEAIVNPQSRFVPPGRSSANFFPLYSFVSWAVGLPLRAVLDPERAFHVGGLLVSSASFLLGLIAVERLATRLAGVRAAGRAVWLIAVFPFSFFFTAVYADALYFCLAAWSLTFAYEQRWRSACALATLATMTRVTGLALYPAIILEYLRRYDFDWRALWKETGSLAILALGPLAIGGYFAWRYDDPLAFLYARQEGWDRGFGFEGLLRDFIYFLGDWPQTCNGIADCLPKLDPTRRLVGIWYVVLVPISLVLVLDARRTLGVGLTAWAVLSVMLGLVNGLDGTGRFTSVLFPVFIAMALSMRSRVEFLSTCAVFVAFLMFFFTQFARWKPVL